MSDTPENIARSMRALIEQELQQAAGIAAKPQTTAALASTGPDRLGDDLLRIAADAWRIPADKLDPLENLANFGVDSIAITELMAKISRAFALSVAPTTFFEARNLNDLARILRKRYAKPLAVYYAAQTPPSTAGALPPEQQDISAWLTRHKAVRRAPKQAGDAGAHIPIAIISMAGKFAASPDLETLEAHLHAGRDCLSEVPEDRWDWRAVFGDPRKGAFTDVKYGGFIDGHDRFDAAFFNISPREAELMDPQHRLFMECVYTLIERGGYAPSSLGEKKIGLFLGINLTDYANLANRAGLMDARQMTGLGHAFCPNRLSFLLDIHGPSEVIDTACSSSLVAVHRAVMAIRQEGCPMAIAGGANLLLTPEQHILFSQVGMLSPEGRCKTFSRHANGYARSDGIGAVLLKRLDHAERDGDNILGIIRASAEHHGGTASSLTAPSPRAQARLIAEAHRASGLDPRSITMIECHGTGTALGDPVEIDGLKQAFAELYRERGLPMPETPACGLGSIKTNIGHAETAAGIAGLFKLLLAMRSGTRYRSLHCDDVNPLIDLAGSPFFIQREADAWKRPVIDGAQAPRRAGLSSFGAGGANVHMVIEEYRAAASPAAQSTPHERVYPVSAQDEVTLRELVEKLSDEIIDADPDDLAFTLQTGRDARPFRAAFVAQDTVSLQRKMKLFLNGDISISREHAGRRQSTDGVDPLRLSPQHIAERWVAGERIDWQKLHQGNARKRLALSTMRFNGKRYWLPVDEITHGFALKQQRADAWQLTLSGTEFYLRDHRLNQTPVLPGVASLEIARVALALAGSQAEALRDIVWVQPLVVSAPITVEAALLRDANDEIYGVEIASLPHNAPRRLHAQIRCAHPAQKPPAANLVSLRTMHVTEYSAAHIYALFDTMGLHYGPAHRTIESLYTGKNTVLARLALPPAMHETLTQFSLHPGLMDGAFQAALGVTLSDSGSNPQSAALPFAVASVEIFAPLAAHMWVHIRPAETTEAARRVQTLDLDLMNDAGKVLVRLRGFATRTPALKSDPALTAQLYAPRWRKAESTPDSAHIPRLILLSDEIENAGAPALNRPHHTCRIIKYDKALPLAQRYENAALQLLRELQAVTTTTLVQLVLADSTEGVMMAGLTAMLRSAAHENPALSVRLLAVPADIAPVALAGAIDQAATARPGAGLRYEDAVLWREEWEPADIAPTEAPWQNGKTYLVTGGLGGIGRHLAQAIRSSAAGATLVLTGRSQPSDETADWLEKINATYIRAELSDAHAAGRLVAGIRERHGDISGILHAAGAMHDAGLHAKTPEQLRAVFAPKVAGTLNLDLAVGDAPLDFFVLFSSLSGIAGNAGQADYAAANGFLDGFAAAREVKRRAGLAQGRTVSIAWPLWAEGGMDMQSAARELMTRATGLTALATRDAFALLAAAIASDAPRLMVLTGDAARAARFINASPETTAPADSGKAAETFPGLAERVLAELLVAAAQQLKVAQTDLYTDVELTEYGFDSIGFTQFANALAERFGLPLMPTVFFEYPTLAALAAHLSLAHATALAERLGIKPVTSARPVSPVAAVPAPAAPSRIASYNSNAVAIIGMSGIFPGAEDTDAFWHNLENGRDCITDAPADRWSSHEQRLRGGFMDDIARFDAAFFGLSAPEARTMDPQQRLLLTQAWRVMEDAGYAPRRLSGSATGVFIGIGDTGYGRLLAQAGEGIEAYAMTGLAPSLGANRISYHFNLRGPSMAVETACSSALIAVHRAAEAIRTGQCETALAGGVNTLLLRDAFTGFTKAGMLSPEARCKPFSADADGYVRGEGVGMVFLKNLAAAERDGDTIIAVIRASGENHGGRAASLTAPNPEAQAALLRDVYGRAGFDPRTLGYIEAHGTGTRLGDPIEIKALKNAFADLSREAEGTGEMRCFIGSVKSNIGHLEIAAGIAGLIKVLLQMQHGKLAASLNCETENPYLALAESPFTIIRKTRPWERLRTAGGASLPRRAGISSFGFGGANAHVALEEYIAAPKTYGGESSTPFLFVLSAHSADALKQVARDLHQAMTTDTASLCDIAYSLQTAREAMEHRLAFAASERTQALALLSEFMSARENPALHLGRTKTNRTAISVLETDDALRGAVAGLAARGRTDGLLELWVKGFAVDWRALHGEPAPRRIRLPGYPFAATRYWPNTTVTAASPVAAAAPKPQPQHTSRVDVLAQLTAIAARILEIDAADQLDVNAELGEFGFDSISMTGFAARVNAEMNLTLSPADFFEFSTLARLARHIEGSAPAVPQPDTQASVSIPAGSEDPIAIVGFSCRFPGAADGDAFWKNLSEGRDSITRIPPERWDWRAVDGDPKTQAGKTNIHWGGFIDGVFAFDPLFFGISPREAKHMDPQQRLLMMHAYNAIEDSGHAPTSLAGRNIGIFVGTATSGYHTLNADNADGSNYTATGAAASIGPNRLSYFLGLRGPSEPIETACSSSLVALHRAVASIRAGECEWALAGGVNTIVTPEAHIHFAKAGMLCEDGRCKSFAADANGYVRGEGVGMLVLKRLSDAERDGDPILAVIRASVINHGGKANSLTAPNTVAQTELLKRAHAQAGIDPASIGYIEAHGTGTAIGDPVEINALKTAFGNSGSRCYIGSVKSNIGHLELAAGAAGIIKALLQMQHRTLAASLHCDTVNPYIDFSSGPFRIVHQTQPWQALRDANGNPLPLRAGISSFGFGGVNAHVILEEYKHASALRPKTGPVIITLSARNPERLRAQAENLLAFLAHNNSIDLHDLAYTLQTGRDAMKQRIALIADTAETLQMQLREFLSGKTPAYTDTALSAVAAGWLQGETIDWASLYTHKRRRLRLPVYPFEQKNYHVKSAVAAAEPFHFRLDADAFYLRDHRVRGACVLPGAMGLELMRRAASGDDFSPITLQSVTWVRPLSLASGSMDIDISFDTQTGLLQMQGEAGGAVFMTARHTAFAEAPATRLALPDIRARCPQTRDANWLYEAYSSLGLDYGPAFRPVEEVFIGENEVLAKLSLPQAATDAACALHPAMLDGAFQSALGLFAAGKSNETALPFALEKLTASAPTTGNMWAHIRRASSEGATHKLDIDLADDGGGIRIRLRGFTLRTLKQEAPRAAKTQNTQTLLLTGKQQASGIDFFAALIAREADILPSQIDPAAELEQYGIDSLMITRLTDRLEKDFGPLPKTVFFEYRTLQAVHDYFQTSHTATLARLAPAYAAVQAPASVSPSRSESRVKSVSPAYEPVAIIGMAGRFPGAGTLEQFWRNLEAGHDAITEIPADRWDHALYYHPTPGTPGKTNGKWGGFIEGHDRFDALFFNISPREAEYLDPQERLFLQCAWETLEDAGITRAQLRGKNVGVFAGVMYEEYQLYGAERAARGQPLALSGSAASIANRVSYFFDFTGPSMAVDSMCSSSLSAIHLACDALRTGSCGVALAGGVNLTLHPNKYLALAQGRFMSSNGRCESFGQGGDGYVPGEGVGAVLLKPLAAAEADGDRILGVIRASALNHGGKTNGYTVPNPAAQTAAIDRALEVSGISARHISYVEAHGTGTKLGDPIEIAALAKAYARHTADTGFCAIGSVKSNIGHCESAAGMAGLAKLLLQFRHQRLAPSLHASTTNPAIDFAASPFRVQQQPAPWPRPRVDGRELPRIAGLSSFGAGGSNAHFIVEEYVSAHQPAASAQRDVYPLSARNAERLFEMAGNLREALRHETHDLAAIAHTLQTGREAFEERLAIVADNRDALIAALDRFLQADTNYPGIYRGSKAQNAATAASASPDAMATAWAQGAAVDWAALRRAHIRPPRVALPTYPFARERYWVPAQAGESFAVNRNPPALPLLFAPRWHEGAANPSAAPVRQVVLLCSASDALRAALAPAEVFVSTGSDYADHAAALLRLLQGLFNDRARAAVVQVAVPVHTPLEGLAGMLRAARMERPELHYQLVAMDYAAGNAAALLATDRACAATDHDVRYAHGKRLVRTWHELTLPATASPWQDDGVYLITGGAGGVGLHVCGHIAASARKPVLWLAGRSALPAAAKRTLDALDAHVHYHRTDIADAHTVHALIQAILRKSGHLNGVLHAAGITRDMSLTRKTERDLRDVLAPKVTGTIALDDATAALELDFMALFSSVSGALGNAGQADYGAANAFLDAFAAQRNRRVESGARHGRTVSINWPYWRDGGMRLGDTIITAMERTAGVHPLETAPALRALDAALATQEDQVLVLEGDRTRLRNALGPKPIAMQKPVTVAAKSAPGSWLTLITACVSDILKIPAERLAPETPIERYGIDSVSALEIVAALERHAGPLPPTILFDHPSIAALCEAMPLLADTKQSTPMPETEAPIAPIAADAWHTPMTEGQKGLWVIQSLYPRSGIYNVPLAFRFNGIDSDTLQRACQWLLAAFPILSAQITDAEGEPCMRACPAHAPLVRLKIPKGLTPADFARQRAMQPFEQGGALSRFELLHAGGDDEIFLIVCHHMVLDGASAAIIADLLWDAYAAFANGGAAPAPGSADFREFAALERTLMDSEKGRAQQSYWLARLAGELPVTDLPADRPADKTAAINGRSLDRLMPLSTSLAVKRAAAELGITASSLLLGVLAILLYRHTGQSDILIGVPTLRRPGKKFERSVGCFVNLLPLRTAVEGGMTARTLLRNVHRSMIEGLYHGEYPFAAIARERGGSLNGEALYQTSFAYQNFAMASLRALPAGTGQVSFMPEIRQTGDGPFGIEVYEEDDDLRLVAGYDAHRFDAAGIERLLDRFIRLATAACMNMDASVGTLDMLGEGETERLRNLAKTPPLPNAAGSLPKWIALQAKKRPDAIALTAGDETLTYAQLTDQANRLAQHLHHCGVLPGDAVAVLLGRGAHSIVALLAALTARAVWVPLDDDLSAQRIEAILADCGAKAVITDRAQAKRLRHGCIIDITRDAAAIARYPAQAAHVQPKPFEPAYMIYTSGSTGTPKGVVVSHAAIAEHTRAVIDCYALDENDIVMQFASHGVDTALEQILPTLASGGRLVIRTAAAWQPDELHHVLAAQHVSVADLPPAYLREALLDWAQSPVAPLPALRLCIVGGEALPADTVRLWQSGPLAHVRLLNAYGPTETTITCLVHEVGSAPPGDTIPIGRPLPGTFACILDADGNRVPEGVVAELHIGGTRLATGYHNRPELTRERFIKAPADIPGKRLYRTGDLASFIPGSNGVIAFHGRVDHQVKIRGYRVEPGEVEATLNSCGLRESAVLPRLDVSGNHMLIACIVPPHDDFDEAALRARMAERLPPHMLPAAYIHLKALPVTAGGKIDRAALARISPQNAATELPGSLMQEQLLGMWARVLGCKPSSIDVRDDFQALGGHSLLWIRLMTEISRAFGCRISPSEWLGSRTVAEQALVLARLLETDGGAKDETPLVTLRTPKTATPHAPLFLVHPITGDVSCYLGLARQLPVGIPVYGIQACTGKEEPCASLEEMAARYIRAIRQVQPQGPYSLAGWSMGGVLAFEMTCQLRQSGESVAHLCLIDSYTPERIAFFDAWEHTQKPGDPLVHAFARDVLGLGEFSLDAGHDFITAAMASPALAGKFSADDEPRLRRQYTAYCTHNNLLMAYAPQPCDTPITLLRAADFSGDAASGWESLAQGGITVHDIPGDHYSLLAGTSLAACAAQLGAVLQERHNLPA